MGIEPMYRALQATQSGRVSAGHSVGSFHADTDRTRTGPTTTKAPTLPEMGGWAHVTDFLLTPPDVTHILMT